MSSIKAASDIVKLVRESGLTLEKAEVKLKLAELVEKLAAAKLELASIQDLVHEKERLISELRAALDTHAKLVFEDYVMGALTAGLRLVELSEHSVDAALVAQSQRAEKHLGWPLLLLMRLSPED